MEKTIVEKLNLLKYSKKAIINRPNESYLSEITDAQTEFPKEAFDLLFVFVKDMTEFKQLVDKVIENQVLNKEGVLFVAYPKKGNKTYSTYVHRDEIFPALQVNEQDGYVGKSNLKFNRMVKLDDTFTVTGIKNVERSEKTKTKQSDKAEDYVQFIPNVKAFLETHEQAKNLYSQLTLGYKKDWARYIFSAKQVATQEKRKVEMIGILEMGYKSKELYRQSLRK